MSEKEQNRLSSLETASWPRTMCGRVAKVLYQQREAEEPAAFTYSLLAQESEKVKKPLGRSSRRCVGCLGWPWRWLK